MSKEEVKKIQEEFEDMYLRQRVCFRKNLKNNCLTLEIHKTQGGYSLTSQKLLVLTGREPPKGDFLDRKDSLKEITKTFEETYEKVK